MTFLVERTTGSGYRGCPFINFCAEFADTDHPGRQVARDTKAVLRERFRRLAEALQVHDPRLLADGLMLLVEGAYAISQTHGGGADGIGRSLVWAAEALVAQQRLRPQGTDA
ncbi:hypothetical protein FF100_03370 [Methylobacterium terricola]|uniref:TetR family transcriptional regulator n=1 Tax=Methylobacterium terricola TaxID=2583531 RepID=A0A5C4LTI1_9HYPH|nr:hypothetical protein [Methylobacterium terricola]TNC16307.1 hypothetical protein FF100_03370 [Methylobacterium terricola]